MNITYWHAFDTKTGLPWGSWRRGRPHKGREESTRANFQENYDLINKQVGGGLTPMKYLANVDKSFWDNEPKTMPGWSEEANE